MTMPPHLIYATQSTITLLFLSRMGYQWHLPWSIMYAPESVGGIGMCHLRHKQGVQQTLQLLQHLRSHSTNGNLYMITIDQYQIYTGIANPILEDTQHLPWMPEGWISSICTFLHTANSQIILQNPWTPTLHCTYDWCIMDDAITCLLTSQLETINSVWMYLKVSACSEITESNGHNLHTSMLDGTATPFSLLFNMVLSTNPN